MSTSLRIPQVGLGINPGWAASSAAHYNADLDSPQEAYYNVGGPLSDRDLSLMAAVGFFLRFQYENRPVTNEPAVPTSNFEAESLQLLKAIFNQCYLILGGSPDDTVA